MIEKQSILGLQSGLHVLNAIYLKDLVDNLGCMVFLKKENQTANCRDVVSLLNLGLKYEDEFTIFCDGIHEEEVLDKIDRFLRNEEE